ILASATRPGAFGWLDERLGLSALREFAAHKTVPLHSATIWYYFGGITLFLFTIQVLTGVLLLLYYRPSPTEAYESVQFIKTSVQFGWLVRSINSWSPNLMISPRSFTCSAWCFCIPIAGRARSLGSAAWCCWGWPWASASADICCPGTRFPTSPPRWGPTWRPACRWPGIRWRASCAAAPMWAAPP